MFEESVQRGKRVAKARFEDRDLYIDSLQSQIDTLTCINASQALEIQLLRTQPEPPSSNLLESFSAASERNLAQVFAMIQKQLAVTDIHQLTPAIVHLVHVKDQYEELVALLDPIGRNPARALERASQITPEFSTTQQVTKKSSVAWIHT